MITEEEERAIRAEHAELMAQLRASETRVWRAVLRDGIGGFVCGSIGIAMLAQHPGSWWWSLSIFSSGALLGHAWHRARQQSYHHKIGLFLRHIGDTLVEGNIAALRRMPAVPEAPHD